jgi:hypothetical protein
MEINLEVLALEVPILVRAALIAAMLIVSVSAPLAAPTVEA